MATKNARLPERACKSVKKGEEQWGISVPELKAGLIDRDAGAGFSARPLAA